MADKQQDLRQLMVDKSIEAIKMLSYTASMTHHIRKEQLRFVIDPGLRNRICRKKPAELQEINATHLLFGGDLQKQAKEGWLHDGSVHCILVFSHLIPPIFSSSERVQGPSEKAFFIPAQAGLQITTEPSYVSEEAELFQTAPQTTRPTEALPPKTSRQREEAEPSESTTALTTGAYTTPSR